MCGDVCSSPLCSSPLYPGKNLLTKNLLRWCLNTMIPTMTSIVCIGFRPLNHRWIVHSKVNIETHTPAVNLIISHSPLLPASRFRQPRCLSTSYTAAAPCILQLSLQNYLYLDNRSSYSIKQCMHGFLSTCSVNVAQQKYKICT